MFGEEAIGSVQQIAGRIFAVSDNNETKIISWGILDTSDVNLGVGEGLKVK